MEKIDPYKNDINGVLAFGIGVILLLVTIAFAHIMPGGLIDKYKNKTEQPHDHKTRNDGSGID